MNASFWRSEALLVPLAAMAAGGTGAAAALLGASSAVLAAIALTTAVLTGWGVWRAIRTERLLAEIRRVSIAARAGDFDQRITLRLRGADKRVADALNNAIDVSDAFVREGELAMAAASQGRFWRKIRPEGMLGAFGKSVAGINNAIDAMAGRQAMIERTVSEVRSIASAAARGELGRAIPTEGLTGDYLSCAQAINSLVAAVAAPIGEVGAVMERQADGDVHFRMTGRYEGAFQRMAAAINASAGSLSRMIEGVQGTSSSLRTATSEILAGADDLSDRTTRQAAMIEETLAALENLSATIAANATESTTASDRAREAAAAARNGAQAIARTKAAMESISASSGRITGIAEVIDDIAFQTNLLALNASVEAARAGDAGKGFSVVAVEVRRLAQSAAGSSAQIKALLAESLDTVEIGGKLVAAADATFGETLDLVTQSERAIEEIARAGQQQALAIEEISIAIRQMDEMTQQNSALAEQTNAAIEQATGQAGELDRMVSDYVGGVRSQPAALVPRADNEAA